MVKPIRQCLPVLIFLTCLASFSTPSYALFQSPDIGEIPPPIRNRETLDGRKFSLETFKGTPLIVYFSGFWCPICSRTTPLIFETFEKYKTKGIKLLYIAADDNSKRNELSKLEEEGAVVAAPSLKICPEFSCPKGSKPGKGWQINSYPTVIVIDSTGVIQYRFNTLGMIKSGLESALQEVSKP